MKKTNSDISAKS